MPAYSHLQTTQSVSGHRKSSPEWYDWGAFVLWLIAAGTVFFPFARGTSAWNAVTLNVAGNQGNWWHVLVGAPFFLAFPMAWLHLRRLLGAQAPGRAGRRLFWALACLSAAGTATVEMPFLLHLAGTSQWQRLIVLSLGFGVLIVSGALLFIRRADVNSADASVAAVLAAYVANESLCLVVYADAPGTIQSRVAWFVCVVLIWPMLLELAASFAGGPGERTRVK